MDFRRRFLGREKCVETRIKNICVAGVVDKKSDRICENGGVSLKSYELYGKISKTCFGEFDVFPCPQRVFYEFREVFEKRSKT